MASVYTTLSPLQKVKLFIVLYLIILILLPVKLLQEPFDIWPIGTYNPKVIMRNIFSSCPPANVGITPLLVGATENLIAMIKWHVIRLIDQIQSASFANGDSPSSLTFARCEYWSATHAMLLASTSLPIAENFIREASILHCLVASFSNLSKMHILSCNPCDIVGIGIIAENFDLKALILHCLAAKIANPP